MLLETKNLTKQFGGLAALTDIDIHIDNNEIIGLIGPNGAGKTTLFNLLTGVYNPTSGSINFHSNNKIYSLNKLKPYEITQLGIARTFQNIRLFKNLTVLDNVKIAMNKDIKYDIISNLLRLPRFYREEEEVERNAIELLTLINLEDKLYEQAKNLPYGEQRKLEIVRALATSPKLLFLDEPAAGMNPHETIELMQFIKTIKTVFNLTIILIEHDMSLVMNICERIYVLDYGKCIASGTPVEIKNNPKVIEAYLGEEVPC